MPSSTRAEGWWPREGTRDEEGTRALQAMGRARNRGNVQTLLGVSRMKRATLIAAGAGLLLLTASCSGGAKKTAAGSESVSVQLTEYSITPAVSSAPAGKITFAVKNAGTLEH